MGFAVSVCIENVDELSMCFGLISFVIRSPVDVLLARVVAASVVGEYNKPTASEVQRTLLPLELEMRYSGEKEKLLLEPKAKGHPVRELLSQNFSVVDSVTRANTTKGGRFDAASFRFFLRATTSFIVRLWMWL